MSTIKDMVNRFLAWPLPKDFAPDGGISFERVSNKGTPHEYERHPSGTNLLTATQAEEMVRFMLRPAGEVQQDMRVTATDQMTDLQWARAIIIHLTGRPDDPTPMLLRMVADIRGRDAVSFPAPGRSDDWMGTRTKGYYWVRSVGYAPVIIAHWDPAIKLWHFTGVSATATDFQVEVLAPVEPYKTPTALEHQALTQTQVGR